MSQPTMLHDERAAGERATHVVYYRRHGKPYLDGVFRCATAADAEEKFLGLARELGWHVEVDRVEERTPRHVEASS